MAARTLALFMVLLPGLLPVAGAAVADCCDEDPAVQAVAALEAYAAYKSGDYEEALRRWQALAARGNTTAMINLANMYQQGQGLEPDPDAAFQWMMRAATAGDRVAQLHVGQAYEDGRAVPRDLAAAERWFQAAAEQGEVEAQFRLGVLLLSVQPTSERRARGLTWLGRAARAGHPDSSAFVQALGPEI
jgi:TPR repeat protein